MKNKDSDQILESCSEEKDLGVTFDDSLSFNAHIQKVTSKANQIIGLIKRSFTFLDKDTFIKLYKAMVRPHLEYGNIIWSPYFKYQSVALEKIQRRATKLLRECKDMDYKERLHYLNLHSLKGRRLRGDLIECYKVFNDENNVYPPHFFPLAPNCNTRNHEKKIYISYCKTNLRKNSFRFRVAKHWNALTPAQKSAQNTNSFKNRIDSDPKLSELFYDFDEQ